MSDESLKLIIRNIGNSEIPVSSTTKINWLLKDSEQNIICNQLWNATDSLIVGDTYCQSGCDTNLPVKGTREIILNISNASHGCFMGGYSNNTMFYFKIDFAGVTATGGSFSKDPASA